jgi:hypothetical protein
VRHPDPDLGLEPDGGFRNQRWCTMINQYTLPLSDPQAELAVVGGRGHRWPGWSMQTCPCPTVSTSPPQRTGDLWTETTCNHASWFHYVNRMVSVLLSETPLPLSHRWVRGPLKRVAGWFFAPAIRRAKALGASLEFLLEEELPADLAWAERAPNVAGAFAGFAAVVDRAGRDLLSAEVRRCVCEDDRLLNALAWGSLTAARKIGTWLHVPGKAA